MSVVHEHAHQHLAGSASGEAECKAFGRPDEVREFPKGRVELIRIGGATIGRAIFEPGWRWATSVQPLAKTQSCEAPHFQYHVSGVLRIRMDNGQEFDCLPGDVSLSDDASERASTYAACVATARSYRSRESVASCESPAAGVFTRGSSRSVSGWL